MNILRILLIRYGIISEIHIPKVDFIKKMYNILHPFNSFLEDIKIPQEAETQKVLHEVAFCFSLCSVVVCNIPKMKVYKKLIN